MLLFVALFMAAQAMAIRGWMVIERMKAEVNAKLPAVERFPAFSNGFSNPFWPFVVWEKHKALCPESALRKSVVMTFLFQVAFMVTAAAVAWSH